jgi:hypothetical protein
MVAAQMMFDRRKVLDRQDGNPFDPTGLERVDRGDEDGGYAIVAGQAHHRQNAVGVADVAVQRELAEVERLLVASGNLLRGHHDGKSDREIVGRTFLLQIGWGQLHRDPAKGENTAGILDRRPHPLARILHRGVGKADDGQRRQPHPAVCLDLDQRPVQADHRAGQYFRDQTLPYRSAWLVASGV